MLWKTAVLFLCIWGLYCAQCALSFRLFSPRDRRNVRTVVWGGGSGEGLENRLRWLVRLDNFGLLPGNIILVDGGLDPTGQALAEKLCSRWGQIIPMDAEQLHRLNEL